MLAPSRSLFTWAGTRASRVAALTSLAAVVAGLAALPTMPAGARSARPAGVVVTPASVSTLAPGEVESVLSPIPLSDLGAAQLGELLSQLPGLNVLPAGKLKESLTKAIEALAAGSGTLGGLGEPTALVTDTGTQLESLLLPGELVSLLTSLLGKGQTISSVLTTGLSSLKPTELLGELLLKPEAHPEQLIEQALAAAGPAAALDGLLSTTLAKQPFTLTTVGQLAEQLSTTAKGFAEAAGTTTTQLPATAMALTAPLTNGKILGVLNGLGGVTLTVLTPPHEETTSEEGTKGTGEEGGSHSGGEGGGSGGSGGSGSGGTGGSGGGSGGSPGASTSTPTLTSLVVNNIHTTVPPATPAKAARPRVRIVSRRVRGHAVTLLLQVSGPGTVAVSGRGVRRVRTQAATAERLRMRTILTASALASMRRHRRRHLSVRLIVSFRQPGGSSASASTAVAFH